MMMRVSIISALITLVSTILQCGFSTSALSLAGATVNRRELLGQTTAALTLGGWSTGSLTSPAYAAADSGPYLMKEYYQEDVIAPSAGRTYFPTLTPPFFKRATVRYELGRNAWAFEQLLTFANVTATIRTNVLLLKDGSLWVHSPQWPTGEFCQLLDEIGHPVKHIVLPCNALEHKAPIKAFSQRYPQASVWISPGQYGPFGACGMDLSDCNMGYKVDGILSSENPSKPPWADEFEMATLYADLPENAGPVSEVSFCHRSTQTLVSTDAVIFVPSKAPAIFETYFDSKVVAAPDFWPKSVLQSVFLPLRSNADGDYPGFTALEKRLVRAPILRAFADARAPNQVRDWVNTISSSWNFDRILTSHFASPIAASPKDFASAFGYLNQKTDDLPPIACQDWELLEGLNEVIASNKLGAPVVYDYRQGCLPL